MWVVQVQNDLVDLSKHFILEIDVLVSMTMTSNFIIFEIAKKVNTVEKQKQKTQKNTKGKQMIVKLEKG